MFRPAAGRFPAYRLIKAFPIYFFSLGATCFHLYLFIPFSSLFPCPIYPSLLRLLPYFLGPASTRHCHQTRAGRCPSSRRCLSLSSVDAAPGHGTFSFLPPLEGIPSLFPPFPAVSQMLPVPCCVEEHENSHPSTLCAQRGLCFPCCITPPLRPGGYLGLSCLPGLPIGTCKWKTDAERAILVVETGWLGRLCAGHCAW